MILFIEFGRKLRNLRRTVLLIIAGALLAGSMALYIDSFRAAEASLRQLPQNHPIPVHIVSRDGKNREGLNIDAAHFDALSDAGVHSRVYTADAVGAYASEARSNGVFDTEISADSGLEITGAQCLVSEAYAERFDLIPGEEISLPISLVIHGAGGRSYTYLGAETLKIAGTFPDGDDLPDLLLPADWLRTMADHSGLQFFYSSFSAVLDDPAMLDTFKENLTRLTFREPSPGQTDSYTGDGVLVEDAAYFAALEELTDRMAGYERLRTPALALLIAFSALAAYFGLLTDRKEMAVAYLLGCSRIGIGRAYLGVVLASEMMGCLPVLTFLAVSGKIGVLSALIAAGILIPGGLIGAAVALTALLGFAPLEVLAPRAPEKLFTPKEKEAAA